MSLLADLRESVCKGCVNYVNGLRRGGCLKLRDDNGKVSTEKLEKAITETGICPVGEWDKLMPRRAE